MDLCLLNRFLFDIIICIILFNKLSNTHGHVDAHDVDDYEPGEGVEVYFPELVEGAVEFVAEEAVADAAAVGEAVVDGGEEEVRELLAVDPLALVRLVELVDPQEAPAADHVDDHHRQRHGRQDHSEVHGDRPAFIRYQ